ncbi:hypothetical protein I317_03265 [Kwoniella heveanensis CBS 569]|nr:hypothetical protein I317_03265 [Kwoniella heveanensis CBS 569]
MTDHNSPPSFDAIFSSQEPPRRSSSNSSSFNAYSYNPSTYTAGTDGNGNMMTVTQDGRPLVEEPQNIHKKGSNASLRAGAGIGEQPQQHQHGGQQHQHQHQHQQQPHNRASSSGSSRSFHLGAGGNPIPHRRQSSLRQESLPFNPEADSTLIATAPRQGQGNNSHPGAGFTSPAIGDIMFGSQQRTDGGTFAQQQHQQAPQHLLQHQQQQLQHLQQQQQQQQPQWTPQRIEDGIPHQLQQQQQQQYHNLQNQPQYSPFHSPVPTPSSAGLDYTTPGTANSMAESSIYDQFSPFSNPAFTPGPQNTGGWGQDFTGQMDQSTNYGNEPQSGAGMDDLMGMNEQDALHNELQRIISNTSHHSSHSQTSQPFPAHNPASVSAGHSRQGSFPTSRSSSPFAQQHDMAKIASPPVNGSFQRTGGSSQAGSPFFNKPQSPPALIIPNQHSPSPVLPNIITAAAAAGPSSRPQHGGIGAPRQGDLGGAVSGGLLPPTNPALEHLTGMAGISPIAPNADGPMIYIQPSTPISGLKDGKGLFDAALRRAGAMAQQNQNGSQGQGEQGQQPQQHGFNVPPPQSHPLSRPNSSDQLTQAGQGDNNAQAQVQAQSQMDFATAMAFQASQGWGQPGSDALRVSGQMRPRAKSDSFMPSPTADSFDRQALFNLFSGATQNNGMANAIEDQAVPDQWRNVVNAWRTGVGEGDQNSFPNPSIDPSLLPGQEGQDAFQQFLLQQQQHQQQQLLQQQAQQQTPAGVDPNSQAHQLSQLQAQRNRLPPLNTDTSAQQNAQGGVLKYEPGEFSPTSMAFYQSIGLYPHSASELPGTTSAPFFTTTFGDISGSSVFPNVAGSTQNLLAANNQAQMISGRRRSFGGTEGSHPAAGAGTPGYGVEFTSTSPFGQLRPGAVRGVSAHGHRRAAKSEDFGRVGTGWGVGAGGSTADFLQSITANDGSLLPPTNRGRSMSHSRNSSASSIRSASPALSISSQGSSFSHQSPRMDMPEGVQVPQLGAVSNGLLAQAAGAPPAAGGASGRGGKKRVAKMKVTSVATEMASTSRRTNSGVFKCPVPGCGSTFTRHFNLKGHLRSHNDERPYKCLYDGCPKSIVGFARQHDCKRHMLLHEGLRPFECEGCGKKFARLDALTRHHKSEQGQECAISHPLPVNPDGSPMSESQYKAYRGIKATTPLPLTPEKGESQAGGGGDSRRGSNVKSEYLSGDDRSAGEEDDLDMDLGGGLSGMEDYDRM